ncbi:MULTISPECIES: DUF1684 domain-containing protein [unclassified Tenacibaculum]|uniref:DUF1684 domain-containing protein n=1 Tax=unclassified Tenacibaculum TaxID=2635139 RepID=UPI001F3315FA|nr:MULTISPECIES: DUF1684 domain-containing protein [unclassified Tenacibaculum]MCF2876565.1 DUF1684 domain-containing protein [Tenacibaculum sp. Cn5-1]MCF2936528.1 DUF1684 domain-containing protein [Tenacibaculum sp. Cn5-34]MCG7511879.1 DUF1684 domain-containing protein [Tenacibaculum sp. Cn5-46]
MKKVILIILVVVFQSCSSQKKRKITGKSPFQIEMNTEFKDASKSPLTKKGLRNFKGLDFFPISEEYIVRAKLTKTPDAPTFNFPTTTDRVAVYKKYGIVSFKINGKDFKLAIYRDEHPEPKYKDNLFLPFLDNTNGKTSYEGGRFIDVLVTDENEDGTITIDFNKAYNPYCAYSDRYSCPITPRDNYLDTEVKAGVMAYKKP